MSEAGPAKISLSLGSRKPASVPRNGLKRSHAALQNEDDDEIEDAQPQNVSHFDKAAGGAIDTSRPQKRDTPLIIAPQKNRNWKEEANRKRQKSGIPNGSGDPALAGRNEAAIDALEAAKKPGFGLNIGKRKAVEGQAQDGETEVMENEPAAPAREKTDDERALDALMGVDQKSDLVLPAVDEEQSFQHDFRTAPDMATLDDYARVPVEQFGAALLRGMGWKEGEGVGSQRGKKVVKTKIPERRPALLGIGAKEDAAVASEMGAWGKAAKKGGEVKIYNPVMLKDKKTGDLFTEEEWQRKKEEEERAQYEREFERKEKDRRRKRDDSRDRRRDRDDDRDREGRREKDRIRDDARHRRDRRRHDDSDEEYYRRKEKERRRRDRDRDDSRERSRRDDNRDRSRDRDREKDRRRYHDRG